MGVYLPPHAAAIADTVPDTERSADPSVKRASASDARICASAGSSVRSPRAPETLLTAAEPRQHLYFCTSKASKLSA